MTVVLWFVVAFGFALVIGHSKISIAFRELLAGLPASVAENGARLPEVPALIPGAGPWIAALLECPMCLGWWVGFVAGASGFIALPLNGLPWWGAGLFLAFATSGVNLLLAKYVGIA